MALAKAIEQLRAELRIKNKEAEQINRAIRLLEIDSTGLYSGTVVRRRKKMSPETVEKIRAAAKRRWAAIKKKTPPSKGK